MTIKQIENKIDILNHSLGLELEPYTYNKKTIEVSHNVGTFYLDSAYGGYKLNQICLGGGCREITKVRMTKREIYNVIDAMLLGIEYQNTLFKGAK
tara:strand:+ start:84 stop:371 length:288 start_codon:yes stop_codon:yes gene_type:complete